MPNFFVYLKCERNVESVLPDVYLQDVGEVFCKEENIENRLKALKIYHFHDKNEARVVISVLEIVESMTKECPNIEVKIVGETSVILEYIPIKGRIEKTSTPKQNKNQLAISGLEKKICMLFVCAISFCGTAFSIMAYHNDIGISHLFANIYELIMGKEANGITVLEVAYSIGLCVGILFFFNHLGGKKWIKDPTPIEVAMRSYEKEIDEALIEEASREGVDKQCD